MTFDGAAFVATLGWAAGAEAAVLVVTFVVAKVVGKHSVIDTTWGLLFVAVAVVVFFRSTADDSRRWLLLILPAIWGLRLAQHIARRTVGRPEDPRYEDLLAKAKGNADLYALRSVYLLQGLLAFVIASPILVGGHETGPVGFLAWLGMLVWVIGVFFETVGDSQMERFRANPVNQGKVIDTGLWRYTRHPNYFGDACVWWGVFLVSADAWPGVVTIYAPIIMTLLLTVGSGARILEKSMSKRDGWADYVARTSMFFPLPRRAKTAATRG